MVVLLCLPPKEKHTEAERLILWWGRHGNVRNGGFRGPAGDPTPLICGISDVTQIADAWKPDSLSVLIKRRDFRLEADLV